MVDPKIMLLIRILNLKTWNQSLVLMKLFKKDRV